MSRISNSFFFILTCACCAVFIAGCHPAYRATATKAQVEKALCGEEWLLFANQPHPIFEEAGTAVKDLPQGMILPKKYIQYKVSQDTLRALFNYLKTSDGRGGIILPIGRHCEAFNLKRSGAMSAALQSKYPDLISVQGQGVSNKASDVRLDWNGELRGQITYNGEIYFITPVAGNNGGMYIVYKKEDSGEVKQPFESAPVQSSQKIYYDR